MSEPMPPEPTPQEYWIVDNLVHTLKVEYRQTGTDTAETYIHLYAEGNKRVVWPKSTFEKVATLSLSWNTCVDPLPGLEEKVAARRAWETENKTEYAAYLELKKKFEGG